MKFQTDVLHQRQIRFLRQRKATLWTLLIVVLVFLTRFHTLFHNYLDWDEAAMMSEAYAMMQGQVLYRDIHQIHPLFQFFIFIPFFAFLPNSIAPVGIKVFNLILVLIGALIMKRTVFSFYKDQWTANLSAMLFILYMSYYVWSRSSHGEFYTVFPILASVYLLFGRRTVSAAIGVAVGFLCGLAFFIKQVAFFDIVPLFIFYLWREKSLSAKTKGTLCFIAGLGLTVLLAVLYPLKHNALAVTFQSIFFQNIGAYIAADINQYSFLRFIVSLSGRSAYILWRLWTDFFSYHPYLSLFVIASTVFAWITSRKGSSNVPRESKTFLYLSIFWIGSICLGIGLIGRFYDHYLLQLSSPLVIFYCFWISTMRPSFSKGFAIALSAGCLLAGANLFVKEQINLPSTIQKAQRSRRIATMIRQNTMQTDTIFLFKEDALDIFYLAERLSPNGIYMHLDMDSAHTNDPQSQAIHRGNLQAHLPRIIVWGTDAVHIPSADAENFFLHVISGKYEMKTEIEGAKIYIRR